MYIGMYSFLEYSKFKHFKRHFVFPLYFANMINVLLLVKINNLMVKEFKFFWFLLVTHVCSYVFQMQKRGDIQPRQKR